VSWRIFGLLAALAMAPDAAAAQGLHVVVVTGLSGEPQYARKFAENAAAIVDAARDRWGAPTANVTYLGEKPASDSKRIGGRATRDGVLAALTRVGTTVAAGDVVLVVLIGHGSQQGDEPRLSLPGPDLTAADLAKALAPLTGQTVVVVNTASASGDFLPALSGKRRVIVTATKSGFERNATVFADHFVKGLATGDADTDKDGRISVAEAFVFARREVARQFETDRRLLTEHAQLDDNGDGKGSADLDGADGSLAKAVSFTLRPSAVAANPEAAGLLAERRRLETAVAELRQRKVGMDSTAYERELERLLLSLAETNQALRALERKTP
jgi:hypothetical protein